MSGQSNQFCLVVVNKEKTDVFDATEKNGPLIATFPTMVEAMAFAAYQSQELGRFSPQDYTYVATAIKDELRAMASVNKKDDWVVYLNLSPRGMIPPHQPPGRITPPGMDHWGGPSMSPQEPAYWGRGPQQQFGPTTFGGPGTYSMPPSRGMSPQQHTSFGWGPNGGPKPGTVGQSKHTCQSCYRPYRAELLVDEEIWEQIKPASGGPLIGLLCPTCVMERIIDLGLSTKGQLILAPKNTTM